jgi:hypothetical protein
MIRAKDLPTVELARVIYLTACAISVALAARGALDDRLYRTKPTPLALWAGLSRGNLLVLLRLLVESIAESDVRRGSRNERGKLRFKVARKCVQAAMELARLVPVGPVYGEPPLEI